MRSRIFAIFALTMLLAAATTHAASSQEVADHAASLQKQADEAYQAKDWAMAAQAYRDVAQSSPKNPRAWLRLAVCLRKTGDFSAATEALEKSAASGVPSVQEEYEKARLYAAMNKMDESFQSLQKALDTGFAQVNLLERDEDLAPLRADARFAGMLEQARKNQKPCAYTPENRQFDFWVGEWNVETTHGGNPVGNSKIELILGDCVVLENWSGMGGGSGKSFNVYNKNKKRWEQYWVDATGGMIHFFGGLKDGVMDYYTEDVEQPDGTMRRRHLQFFNLGPDKVRQFSQRSTDGGKTWTVEYDFTYIRKNSSNEKKN
jgi:tetratricopeptide (TPR) repeat protein